MRIKRTHWSAILIALLLAHALPASAQECGEPAIVNTGKLSSDTHLALNFVKSLFGSVKGVEQLVKERDSIFAKFPDGQQGIIVYTMYINECNLIIKETTLTFKEKMEYLKQLDERLLSRVSGPQPVVSTKKGNQSFLPLRLPMLSSRYGTLRAGNKSILVKVGEQPATPPNPLGYRALSPSDFIENENEWLRKQPFQVTDNNKHFVIVESFGNENDGKAAIKILKEKHPKYDFTLYAPYDGNTNYGIMIATWASFGIAQKALAVAKTINPTAFIWSCRSTGDTC